MQYFQRERPTTFLDLPAEIRIDIYDLLLVQRPAVSFRGRLLDDTVKFNVYPHVLRVCRQIHEEAASVFYGRNEMRLLLYGIHGVPYQRWRSGSLSRLFEVGTLYLRLVKRLELVAFPEKEQILGEINIAKPLHGLLAKGDGMQGLECLTITCCGTDVTKAQTSVFPRIESTRIESKFSVDSRIESDSNPIPNRQINLGKLSRGQPPGWRVPSRATDRLTFRG
jgi:hypothetical protein